MADTNEDCVFCRIIDGELPSRTVYEDDHTLALLDINPISRGHTLVIPKHHVQWFYEMDDTETQHLFVAARTVATKIKHAFDVEHVSMLIRGTRVPHVHVFLIPKLVGEDNIFDSVMDVHQYVQERQQEVFLEDEELDEIEHSIRDA